jgi:phosphohistidine phosphatase
MKTLLLMRHGKSSWKEDNLPDHERPMKKRGRKCATHMGELLKDKELVPQLILCSTAVRTRQTAEALMKGSGFEGKIDYLDTLYLAEPDAVLTTLNAIPDEIERVMVIGHNPGLETMVQTLGGKIKSMPTSAVACFALPVKSWKALDGDIEGELIDFWKPSDLKGK